MLPAGYRLIELEETVSTNTFCLEAAQSGDPGNLWVRADRQAAGRGSRGRPWVSETGNLFASLLLVDPAPREALPNLTFVAALAVREAIAELAAAHRQIRDIALKWPNDVLISGRKVSGILLESHTLGDRAATIIGIGVNCSNHPQDVLHRATDLASEGILAPPRDLLEVLASKMDAWLTRWERGTRFHEIRRSWLEQASGLGNRIYVRLPGRELSGTFQDIDADGYLILSLDDGSEVRISAADVFLDDKN